MERIGRANVEHYLERLNKGLEKQNSTVNYRLSIANGAYSLHLYKGDIQVDTLIAGLTLRGVYNAVYCMSSAVIDGLHVDKP